MQTLEAHNNGINIESRPERAEETARVLGKTSLTAIELLATEGVEYDNASPGTHYVTRLGDGQTVTDRD